MVFDFRNEGLVYDREAGRVRWLSDAKASGVVPIPFRSVVYRVSSSCGRRVFDHVVPEAELSPTDRRWLLMGSGVRVKANIRLIDWIMADDMTGARKRQGMLRLRLFGLIERGCRSAGEYDRFDREVDLLGSVLEEASLCGMQVDHIFPLNGERVSGLHVRSNLMMVSARWNRAKRNRYPARLVRRSI